MTFFPDWSLTHPVFLKALPPDTLEGIEKYLGSGLIKGIGPHFAKKLVSEFGDKVMNQTAEEIYKLLEKKN